MRSSELGVAGILLLSCCAGVGRAGAQAFAAQGFAVERFYASPAGSGWLGLDDLDTGPGLGGAVDLVSGYARRPFAPTTGGLSLPVVSDQAFAEVGMAVSYDRYRLSLHLPTPLVISGQSGTAGGFAFAAPRVNLANDPDTLSDATLGVDARLLGEPQGRLRLGAAAQLIVPSGSRADYDTDGTYRGMLWALAAGDVGEVTYAAQLGLHLRPLDEAGPGTPRGSELLFAAGLGERLRPMPGWAVVVGPELQGETALRSFFGGSTTGLEALLTARWEGAGRGLQPRVKAAVGVGLVPRFGAPEWRAVVAFEELSR